MARIVALVVLLIGAVPANAGWELSWSDEFDENNIDSTKWVFETGNNNGWGNSERQYYTSRTNNAFVSNGVLHIVARQESMGGFPYTSARMKTQGKFSQQYGRFEFRAKMPQGLGFWPALWMMGTNITSVGWPSCGEIDVMEFNGSWSNKVQGTIHYPNTSGAHTSQTAFSTFPTPGDSATNFHTYAIEWTVTGIKWLVDGVGVTTWRSWSSSAGAFPAPFDQPFFLLMNVAVGGSYLGRPSDATINANTVFPGEMQVDYVRVYNYVSTAPESPTGFNVGVGNGKVFLSWEPCTGASGYIVKRATVSEGPFGTLATVSDSAYTDLTAANCSTFYYTVIATNSLGESSPATPQSAKLGAYSYAVNSGGAVTGSFVADTGFSGGTQAAVSAASIDVSGVVSPAPQSVYQTERYGNFSYLFTGLSNGVPYKIRLHFAETYWTAVGQRRFNVSINGTGVLSGFDILAAAGAPNKAIVEEFNGTPSSGQIVIQFTTVTDNAKCGGIELILPRSDTPIVGNNGPLWEGMTLNLTASTVAGATYSWTGPNGFASTNQNPSIEHVSTNMAGIYSVTTAKGTCISTAATTTVTVNPPPTLSIRLSGGEAILSWPAGILLQATNILGPWEAVIGATSPLTNFLIGQREFYRLQAP